MKTKTFRESLYGMRYSLVVGTDAEAKKWILRRAPWLSSDEDFDKMFDSGSTAGLTVFCEEEFQVILWLPKWGGTYKEFGTLAHEVAHATFYTCDTFGLTIYQGEENESFCYLSGFIYCGYLSALQGLTKQP